MAKNIIIPLRKIEFKLKKLKYFCKKMQILGNFFGLLCSSTSFLQFFSYFTVHRRIFINMALKGHFKGSRHHHYYHVAIDVNFLREKAPAQKEMSLLIIKFFLSYCSNPKSDYSDFLASYSFCSLQLIYHF